MPVALTPGVVRPWTRVWSQFRRWSRNGTRARTRGASNGGFTFHDRGGLYGRTKGAKRVVAVDVPGFPVAAVVVPASTHENRASDLMLEHLTQQGFTDRLELVLVDRGVTAAAARNVSRGHDVEVRRVGWDDNNRCSALSGTPGASRSPTAACIATTLRHLSRERAHQLAVDFAA